MPGEPPIKVIVFEDNKHYRESLYYIISGTAGYECVGAFANADDALLHIRQTGPDVVLMDIEMPGTSGIEAVCKIKQEFPALQVLMQTVFNDDDSIFNSICAGASGYLLKSSTPIEILNAIQDVFHGGSPLSSSIARRVLHRFQQISPKQTDKPVYSLTPREKEVLSLLVEGKSYKMIAAQCNISYETVRSHMKNIYEKLHAESLTEVVAKAIRERIV